MVICDHSYIMIFTGTLGSYLLSYLHESKPNRPETLICVSAARKDKNIITSNMNTNFMSVCQSLYRHATRWFHDLSEVPVQPP